MIKFNRRNHQIRIKGMKNSAHRESIAVKGVLEQVRTLSISLLLSLVDEDDGEHDSIGIELNERRSKIKDQISIDYDELAVYYHASAWISIRTSIGGIGFSLPFESVSVIFHWPVSESTAV